MKTLPLSWDKDDYWDLVLTNKNWTAIDSETIEPDTGAHIGEARYCAQTVANSCRMFRDDAYFFPQEGVPYFENVLGKKPPQSLVYAYLREAGFLVPLVRQLNILNYKQANRVITGQIRITTENGSVEDVSF